MPELPKVNPQFGKGTTSDSGDIKRGPFAPSGSARLQQVREGDAYPAGLKHLGAQQVSGTPGAARVDDPPQVGAPEPAEPGRCNFVLEIRGSCLDNSRAREAVRKAVQHALDPDRTMSVRAQEARVEVGSVVMR